MDSLIEGLTQLRVDEFPHSLIKRTDQSKIKVFLQEFEDREDPICIVQNHDIYADECLRTLDMDEWVNDAVINAFLQTTCDVKKVYLFNTFFYSKLEREGFDGVKRWTKKVNLSQYDKLLIPINSNNAHWLCAVVDIKQSQVQVFDSMRSPGKAKHVGENLNAYLKNEWKVKQYSKLPDFDVVSVKCPQQQDGASCGIYTCLNLVYTAYCKKLDFGQSDIHNVRYRIVETLIKEVMEDRQKIYVKEQDDGDSGFEVIE